MKYAVWALLGTVALAGCAEEAPGGSACDDATLVECQVFELVNSERGDQGLPAYAWSEHLALAAERHAEDMVAQDYFDHESLDGRSFADRAREAGYDASPTGENIAAGQRSADQVMTSWMNSSGHRANILSDRSNEIGVGFVDNHWVQVFGRRAVTTD